MMKAGVIAAALAMLGACDAAPNSAPSGTSSAAANLTLAKLSALRTGMTYAEAASVLGFDGTEQSSSEIGGTKTVMYAWANAGGMENINAMFQGDKLVTKAQFGLK